MSVPRIRTALLAVIAAAGLSACAEDGYGYGGVEMGYNGGGYGDGYYANGYDDNYYGDYGSGYGWYDGFSYPGAGIYIYDRGGNRYHWNRHHQDHWQGHGDWHGGSGHDGDGDWRMARKLASAATATTITGRGTDTIRLGRIIRAAGGRSTLPTGRVIKAGALRTLSHRIPRRAAARTTIIERSQPAGRRRTSTMEMKRSTGSAA